jgi:alpha-tubulin suppressor-like RCC1 family protein
MIATPTRVSAGLLRFSQITAGDSHTCAIATTGATYCWGGNGRGELGQDTAVGSGRIGLSSRVPVELPTTLRFASIDAGTLHTCGVTVAGTAYCWGSREYGQLGDGIVGGLSIVPVAVGGTEHFLQVSAGSYTTCGVSLAHQVFCWGAGASGVLGNGTVSATQALPNAVSGSLRARAVAVNLAEIAGLSACALSDLSEVFCWGAGASGQLGTGQRTASSVPVQVRLLPPE